MHKKHMIDHYDFFFRFMVHAACGRLIPLHRCYTTWDQVTCKKCLRHRPRPDQTVPPPHVPIDQK